MPPVSWTAASQRNQGRRSENSDQVAPQHSERLPTYENTDCTPPSYEHLEYAKKCSDLIAEFNEARRILHLKRKACSDARTVGDVEAAIVGLENQQAHLERLDRQLRDAVARIKVESSDSLRVVVDREAGTNFKRWVMHCTCVSDLKKLTNEKLEKARARRQRLWEASRRQREDMFRVIS